MDAAVPASTPYQRLGNVDAATEDERVAALSAIVHQSAELMDILRAIRDLAIPDAWLTSGAIYQTVWNLITQRPATFGIKDYDIIYFDGTDRSYEAEDHVISKVKAALPRLSNLVEVRNQARVHLWYENRFGRPYRPLDCTMDALTRYASRTHAVALRLDNTGSPVVHTPFGLANIFAMRLVPNYSHPNKETYTEKASRVEALWPELQVVPWDETGA